MTVTALRGFLGLANYYSCYVPLYAQKAAPLMGLLCVGKREGRKGSKVPLKWGPEQVKAFGEVKKALSDGLKVFSLNPDKPFRLRTDASRNACGAVLEQEKGGVWVPIAFCSRKLTQSQRNWTPREKETYAIIMALKKWSGWIGFQPVTVLTDHKALENWVTEYVDTPSGPAGRRARWHEVMSKFDLRVKYVKGKYNVVANALSRWAYPANRALQDCSPHGGERDATERKRMIKEQLEEG